MSLNSILRGALAGCAALAVLAAIPGCRTLTAGNGLVTGTMNYGSPTMLPAGSIATVELVRHDAGLAPTSVARAQVTPTTATLVPFQLTYDPTTINPEIVHALRATITSPSGQVMYMTSSDVAYDFDGQPVMLDLVAATGTTTAPPGGTVGTTRR